MELLKDFLTLFRIWYRHQLNIQTEKKYKLQSVSIFKLLTPFIYLLSLLSLENCLLAPDFHLCIYITCYEACQNVFFLKIRKLMKREACWAAMVKIFFRDKSYFISWIMSSNEETPTTSATMSITPTATVVSALPITVQAASHNSPAFVNLSVGELLQKQRRIAVVTMVRKLSKISEISASSAESFSIWFNSWIRFWKIH